MITYVCIILLLFYFDDSCFAFQKLRATDAVRIFYQCLVEAGHEKDSGNFFLTCVQNNILQAVDGRISPKEKLILYFFIFHVVQYTRWNESSNGIRLLNWIRLDHLVAGHGSPHPVDDDADLKQPHQKKKCCWLSQLAN